jgi:hypothetical protein
MKEKTKFLFLFARFTAIAMLVLCSNQVLYAQSDIQLLYDTKSKESVSRSHFELMFGAAFTPSNNLYHGFSIGNSFDLRLRFTDKSRKTAIIPFLGGNGFKSSFLGDSVNINYQNLGGGLLVSQLLYQNKNRTLQLSGYAGAGYYWSRMYLKYLTHELFDATDFIFKTSKDEIFSRGTLQPHCGLELHYKNFFAQLGYEYMTTKNKFNNSFVEKNVKWKLSLPDSPYSFHCIQLKLGVSFKTSKFKIKNSEEDAQETGRDR